MWLRLPLLALLVLAGPLPGASLIMPDLAGVPTGWQVDRYDPHTFSNVGTFQGRDNVLGIEITSAEGFAQRPAAFESTFYNTQGRNNAAVGGADSTLAADLFIPDSWSNSENGSFRSDLWGVMTGGGSVTDYPIIGFTNYGGTPRYRVWDGNTANGWVDLGTPVVFDAWTAFAITFTGTSYSFSINGSTVYTDHTINGSTAFSALILQAYNVYGDLSIAGASAVDYTADWSNDGTAAPEPGTWGLLGGGLMLAGVRFHRKRARPTA